MLDYTKSFIEQQFPVSKISKESYKERKAGASQTITGLGKWWGRKPLILVRATILGILMPVSDNLVKDREVFLKILTMDNQGLWIRKSKNITTKDIYNLLNLKEKEKYFDYDSIVEKPKYMRGLSKEDKEYLQKTIFNRMSYDKKLVYCSRPEHIENLREEIWQEINEHLKTSATSFSELISELGQKRYGHTPRVGDCFSGGGSIPFEAARLGCHVYASDLNPIAALLTWASLNIAGASDEEIVELRKFQQKVYDKVDEQIIEWRIEHNEQGHRADSYLYCNETICPECGWKVPLAPSWIIGKRTKTVALLKDNGIDGFDIEIVQDANKAQYKMADKNITIKNYNLVCPHCEMVTPIPSIRGDYDDGVIRHYRYNTPNMLRKMEKKDFMYNGDDIFTERLYCIRYSKGDTRYYKSPDYEDLSREKKITELLSERFDEWQEKGYIPNSPIEIGWNTNQLIYERGWQYWHQLFNSRQLLINGLVGKTISQLTKDEYQLVSGMLALNKCVDRNSKICRWDGGSEKAQQTFYNQAFNTLSNYVSRGWISNLENVVFDIEQFNKCEDSYVAIKDARNIDVMLDIWITDPPYADAVNYHELTEFFLAWDKVLLEKAFPEWYTDSKRVLAVKGTGESFNESMIEIYKNLANNMPGNGTQVVMFTHQDVKVWAELAMILWSSGLRVVSAWNIATETDASGLKSGNYVKGTVLLTLKKQTSNDMAFQDELYDDIKMEVENIIDSMDDLDDKDDPDFTDADYLLASYAASLKVLTSYKEIDGIDVKYWLAQSRNTDEENPVEALINKAVKIAYDYLIPEGFDKSHWKDLTSEERFFIRGLEIEMNGSYQISLYQELARGFGVRDYTDLFAEFRANSTRLMTPSEFKMRNLNTVGFGSTTLRYLLVAINEGTSSGSAVEGRAYLKTAYPDSNEYWFKKPIMIELLTFVANLENIETMEHWHKHANSAKILREALKNEGI